MEESLMQQRVRELVRVLDEHGAPTTGEFAGVGGGLNFVGRTEDLILRLEREREDLVQLLREIEPYVGQVSVYGAGLAAKIRAATGD